MAIKYRVVQKPQPGVPGGGVKKFYASNIMDGETTIEGITREIERISTVSGADIRAVLYALVDVIPDRLSESRIVRIGDLGSFRVSISSQGFDEEEEVTASAIRGAKLIFTPGPKLKHMLNTLVYRKTD